MSLTTGIRTALESVRSTKAGAAAGKLRVSCHAHGVLGENLNIEQAVQLCTDHLDCAETKSS